ncbi:MAG TPA: murein L,D-transpeptidase [Clostridiaceae bacterium]|nr:murein L,D-transpeptidase [Clostridiaceae bacterium]
MVKILTAIFIFCSLCAQEPNISDPECFYNKVNESIVVQYTNSFDNNLDNNEILPAQDNKEEQKPEDKKPVEPENKQPEIDESKINYIEELKKLKYYKEESKDNDLNLRNAVLRFQSDHNLVVNGVWDKKEFNTLVKRLKDSSFKHPDTVKKPPTDSKWMTVNITKRILTLYEGSKVVKKYPVAVGNPPSLTPSGKFTIKNKIVNPAWGGGGYAKPVPGGSPNNPLGYRWMGLSYKGGSRYGIHGNNSPYSIGKDVSHGCIRMINSDVEELFEKVTVSMPVWIGTNSELEEWGVVQSEY